MLMIVIMTAGGGFLMTSSARLQWQGRRGCGGCDAAADIIHLAATDDIIYDDNVMMTMLLLMMMTMAIIYEVKEQGYGGLREVARAKEGRMVPGAATEAGSGGFAFIQ